MCSCASSSGIGASVSRCKIICVGGREIADAAVLLAVDQRTDAAHRTEPSFDCEAYEFHGCPRN
jgi:hypothetical protein